MGFEVISSHHLEPPSRVGSLGCLLYALGGYPFFCPTKASCTVLHGGLLACKVLGQASTPQYHPRNISILSDHDQISAAARPCPVPIQPQVFFLVAFGWWSHADPFDVGITTPSARPFWLPRRQPDVARCASATARSAPQASLMIEFIQFGAISSRCPPRFAGCRSWTTSSRRSWSED